MEEEIKAEFLKSGFTLDEEEMLRKCHNFCQDYSLQPSDLVSSWVLDAEDEDTNNVILGTPTVKSEKLHLDIYDSARKANGNIYSSERKSNLVTPFGTRSNKFVIKFNIDNLSTMKVVSGIGDNENHEDGIIKRIQPLKSCSLIVHGSRPERGCRFLYDRNQDRFNAIENRIKKHTAAFVACNLYEEPRDPSVASQRSIFAVGMICCDSEGHLNDKSIFLQSSVEHAGGRRVRLELNKLSHFSFFPGQIVGIKDHNPSGHCLIASEIVDYVPFSIAADTGLPPAKKQALDEEIQATDLSSTPTEITMPLSELLAYATRNSPQLLILLGPFIDSEHPQVKKGTVDLSFDDIFRSEVLRMVQDYLEYMGPTARVVMIPSVRDANHDFIFPQPAFDLNSLDVRHQITSLNNPGIFEANQVKIGCCTVDILKHLSGEEMSRYPWDGKHNDRLSKLAGHILSQRSFYPLYPPAEGVPMDFSLAPVALHIFSFPDLLILPSDIKYFVKVLSVGGTNEGEEQMKRCVCINPGRLAKGEGGGTFVELKYQGSPDKMNASIISI